jgi:Yip1 domain
MAVACLVCGTVALPSARFCASCGALLPAGQSAAPPKQGPISSPATVAGTRLDSAFSDQLLSLLKSPSAEWAKIATDPVSASQVFWRYAAIVGAFGPLCGIVGSFRDERLSNGSRSLASVLFENVSEYVFMTLMVTLFFAYSIRGLSKAFGSPANLTQSMKVAAYAQTGFFLLGTLNFFPNLLTSLVAVAWVGIAALIWTAVLLRGGLMAVMKVPALKALPFTMVLVVVYVLLLVVSLLPASIGYMATQ